MHTPDINWDVVNGEPNTNLHTLVNEFDLLNAVFSSPQRLADFATVLGFSLNEAVPLTKDQKDKLFQLLFPKDFTGKDIPFILANFLLELPIRAAIINTIWNPYVGKPNNILGVIFGPQFDKKFDPNNAEHNALLSSLANQVGGVRVDVNGKPDDGAYPAYLLTDDLQLDTTQRLPRLPAVSDLLAALSNQRDVITFIWVGSPTIGSIFGSDFAGYNSADNRNKALAAMLADQIGTGQFKGKTLDRFLALEDGNFNRFPDWQSLKAVLDDQARAVTRQADWIKVLSGIFGLSS